MGIVAKDSGKDFVPCPEGVHDAVCVDVVDRGMIDTAFGKKHKVQVRWQVDAQQEDGKRFMVVQSFTMSLNPRAGLSKLLQSWLGRRLTDMERKKGFDVESMIGANCVLNVIHSDPTTDGTVYANIMSITPHPKGKLKPKDYVRAVEREDNDFNSGPLREDQKEDNDIPF